MYIAICVAVFLVGFVINTTMITVFYHRAIAHRAVSMKPWMRRFVVRYGNWLTGLDPKGWVCMHRLHHRHSDQEGDPHSPVQFGIFGVLTAQLNRYKKILVGLHKGDERYCSVVQDLDFPISWLNRKRIWWLPYVVHIAIGVSFGVFGGWWALGACYFFGIMGHPIEGWLVNSLGHAVGGRNFDTPDNSRNNQLIAWLIMGEGYQNNHHRYPSSAKFSYRWYEVDWGYAMCRFLSALGVIGIYEQKLLPAPPRSTPAATTPQAAVSQPRRV